MRKKHLPKCRSEPVRVRGADFLRFVYRAEHADDREPGRPSTITSRLKAGGRVAQVECDNQPTAASHPCPILRRRSGRRDLCRTTAGSALHLGHLDASMPSASCLPDFHLSSPPPRPPACATMNPMRCRVLRAAAPRPTHPFHVSQSPCAPPRSPLKTTTFVRASRQTTILVRASDPVPTLRSCVPQNPRHTTSSPGPPSSAARLWRSFDGGVG
jgi:hypothetical protein